ncbi:tripartite tricarboxylate transporter substrate binding protein [Vandammella animalimorsus]|uniref:Tripartite tricarboxylate transporter substrate binding protein n=1 Tax=Vandammella animalimorsus TaxID=2029117 RepID=A0A3M6QVX0_9BURK|nr:tripartite tricarboxylate transporter substrate-binding protein [Vandammella animalimorsus]RMX07155.1 tripartite tricarboxylate transporter substrate binding protein [Vandammella animalimorsus]
MRKIFAGFVLIFYIIGFAYAGWPEKNVTLMVPYAPGGGADTIARLVGGELSKLWGVSVVVENKSGANGVIGSHDVAKSAPDGYKIMLVVGSHVINPILMKSMPFDTERDFTPITQLASSPMVLVVAADGSYGDLNAFISEIKKGPVSLGYSEGQTQLTGELLRQASGGQITPVAYRGGSPLMMDIIGGHVQSGFTSIITALPHVRAGKLRVIGVANKEGTNIFPEAKTFAEVGLPQVDSSNWYGLFGPKNMSDEVIKAISDGLMKVAQGELIESRLKEQGGELAIGGNKAFHDFLAQERMKWMDVARIGEIEAK